jgi:phenylpropionate dioxygenase-like ring-hydroxylating dioxygenase large terminal subunit
LLEADMTTIRPTIDYDYLVQDDKVHGDIYTSQDVFEDEMEKIFHRWWVFVGHASEIPEPGDYVLRWIGRQSVIMCRDEDGQVRLLMNRCRHRANAVCQHEKGNANYFRCWYHGWTYSNTGDLIGVPYPTGYDDAFRKEDYGLTPAPRMGNYRGFIYGSLSPTGVSFDEYLGNAKAMIDVFCDLSPMGEIEVRAGVNKGSFKGNWKFVGMDGYHVNFTHASVMDIRRRRTGVSFDISSDSSGNVTRDMGGGHVRLDYWQGRKDNADQYLSPYMSTAWGREYVESLEQKLGKERARELLVVGSPHMGMWPNLQLIDTQIRLMRPIAADLTEVYMFPTLLKGVPPEVNAKRLRAHESFFGPAGNGSPDDYEMFERNQVGLSCQVDPWLLLSRGRHRERREPDGTLVGNYSDEVSQRGQLRQWKHVMTLP